MRILVKWWWIGAIAVGLFLEVYALVYLRFIICTPPPPYLAPACATRGVISSTWFFVLLVLFLISIGGIFSKAWAVLGLIATGVSTIMLAVLAPADYYILYYLGSPSWFPTFPINWIGAALVFGVLTRVLAPRVAVRTAGVSPAPSK